MRFIFLVAFVANFNVAQGQTVPFKTDTYSLAYPANWSYKLQQAPDGAQLHMFMGPEQRNALPYCHVTQQPINASLMPRTAKMNEQQKVEFFSTAGGDLLFSLYDNLASAQGFRLIHTNAAVLGQSVPAFTADFMFRTPQGFAYRVRSHYTFWSKAQLSVWCQAVSRSDQSSEDAFLRNLASFQQFVASVRILK